MQRKVEKLVESSFLTSLMRSVLPSASKDEKPKKPVRTRTDYSANVTASLALPTHKTFCEKETSSVICDDIKKEEPPSQSFFTSLYSLFATPSAFETASYTKVDVKKDSKAHIFPKIPIAPHMEKLQSEAKNEDSKSATDKLLCQQVELVAEEIKEHAARRVDLFFYLLIAVYNKQYIIATDDTIKQHGKGSKKLGTQACHSSFFPNLKIENTPGYMSWLFSSESPNALLNTFFAETLNMTVELPWIVNAFDGHLEGRYQLSAVVKTCLELLNKTSKNEITPLQAMHKFIEAMNDYFNHFEKKYLLDNKIENPEAMRKAWEYEKAGTFHVAKPDMKSISNHYIHLALRLKPAEIAKVKNDPNSLNEFYKRIQDEIYAAKAPVVVAKSKQKKPKGK